MSSDKKHGLGKGIGSLLGSFDYDSQVESIINKTTASEKTESASAVSTSLPITEKKDKSDSISAIYVPLSSISANPNQPRKSFDEESLKELSISIKEQGIIQPIIVEEIVPGRYSIIAGERRFRAAKMAGINKVPVIIKSLNEMQRIQMSLIENIQRENLNPIEEASAYQYLMQRSDMTQEQVAEKVGKSRSAIANSVRLLSLSDAIKDDLISGQISAGHARAILSLVNPSDQKLLRDKIIERDLSVREAEKLADEYNKGHKIVPKKKDKDDDPEITEIEERFVSAIGNRCEIKGNLSNGKLLKGKLLIRYRSQQDLERIYSLLSDGGELFTE